MKVLIVEDDYIVRKGIICSLEWEKYGLVICGECSNGEQGIIMAEEQKPDIIITDVRMPIMNGLKFSEKVKKILPSVKIIVLSGYEDFQYAKEAIRIGVYEYLLKPIDAAELLNCVCLLKNEIERERTIKIHQDSMEMMLDENKRQIYDRIMNQLISPRHKEQTDEIKNKMSNLGIVFSGSRYKITLLLLEDFQLLTQNHSDGEIEGLLEKTREKVKTVFSIGIQVEVFLSSKGHFVLLFNYDRNSKIAEERNYHTLIKKITEEVGFQCVFACGLEKESMEGIYESYQEAMMALRSRSCKSEKRIIYYESSMQKKQGVFIEVKKEEKMLIEYLQKYDVIGMKRVMNMMLHNAIHNEADFQQVKATCARLSILIITNLEEMGIELETLNEYSVEFLWEIQEFDTMYSLKKWIVKFLDMVSAVLTKTEKEKYNVIIRKALEYVEKYYAEEIQVKNVAAELYITPNYFSQIFKAQKGIAFTDYLNQFRINKAKNYLDDMSLKIYQVAEMTGYQNYKYFNKVFRKYVGCSPKEYRNQKEERGLYERKEN